MLFIRFMVLLLLITPLGLTTAHASTNARTHAALRDLVKNYELVNGGCFGFTASTAELVYACDKHKDEYVSKFEQIEKASNRYYSPEDVSDLKDLHKIHYYQIKAVAATIAGEKKVYSLDDAIFEISLKEIKSPYTSKEEADFMKDLAKKLNIGFIILGLFCTGVPFLWLITTIYFDKKPF